MDDVLSLPAAAIRLGRSWQVTYNLALAGKLGPLQRVNGHYTLSLKGVEAFLKRERAEKAVK
jgi:hypothetical protein